jgi:predicted metalloprotease with PDZ domain
VDEGLALYGAKHFDHYDLLLALTDRMGGIGLEHHRSSENQYEPRTWIDWAANDWDRNVIPHEFSHSWDGKFRRPAKLWTPDYRQPMQDNLLWVYEGQDQFWGYVLAARSGVQTKDTVLGMLANNAGLFTQYPGREWRSVEDTTHDPLRRAQAQAVQFPGPQRGVLHRRRWSGWKRTRSSGRAPPARRARRFRQGLLRHPRWRLGRGALRIRGRGFHAQRRVPHDWASFLKTRIQTPGQPAPLGGIERGGYKLVWKAEPNPFDKARAADSKALRSTIRSA